MKKKSKNIKLFVENIRLKSTYCQININQIGELMDTLAYHFITDKAMEEYEFAKLLTNSLFGLCSKCGTKYPGIIFTDYALNVGSFKLSPGQYTKIYTTMKDRYHEYLKIIFSGYMARSVKQFNEGKCVYPKCASKKIEIHWEYMNSWKLGSVFKENF